MTQVTFTLDDDSIVLLDKLAEMNKVSRSKQINLFLKEYFKAINIEFSNELEFADTNNKTLFVRIDAELYERVEASRVSRVDLVTEALNKYFHNKSNQAEEQEEISRLQLEFNQLKLIYDKLEEILHIKENWIKDLQTQLGWMQFEYSKINAKLLMPAPEPEKSENGKPEKKPWFKFWLL